MGFRDYSPGLNRFLSRDMYTGALADLNLQTSPWTNNRYAFTGGNPTTFIEIDGHKLCEGPAPDCAPWPATTDISQEALTSDQSNLRSWDSELFDDTDTCRSLECAPRTTDGSTAGYDLERNLTQFKSDLGRIGNVAKRSASLASLLFLLCADSTQGCNGGGDSDTGGNEVLFGQARIGEHFSTDKAPSYLAGRSTYDVAVDLEAGRLTPDMIRVDVFENDGDLVALNNRGLAALSLAGLQPTNIRMRQPTGRESRRLSEPTPLGDSLPSRRILVTRSLNDWTPVPRSPNPIYIPGG